MSDISTVTAPAASAPPPAEVTIPDQSPQLPDGAVGPQAPDKSPERLAQERSATRREAIERAFARSKEAQAALGDRGKTGGEDRGKPEVKDAGKPEVKADQKSEEKPRGERGRFVSSKPADADAGKDGRQPADASPHQAHSPLAADAPFRDPPSRFSDAAKADWAGVPETVRGAVHQAHQEMVRGIEQYRAAAQAHHELRDFHDLAQRGGTTVKEALNNYWGIEQRLRSDMFGGVDLIINNLGIKKADGSRYNVYDFARDVLRLSPEQHRLVQQQNRSQAHEHRMAQLMQQQERLAANLHQMQYRAQFKETRSAIDQFANAHPGFDERLDLIKQEMDHGYPLKQAYERAMRLRPNGRSNGRTNGATHAAQTRDTSAQTRSDEVDRSISGAPNGGTPTSQDRPKKKAGSNREALANAQRRLRSGV